MRKVIFITFILCAIVVSSSAQYVRSVKDPGLNGQLKRMVDQQWDDWKPDPNWKFFGLIPRDPTGALMWGALNRSYWKGKDRRPYRPGGQFQQNLTLLKLEKEQAKKIADSVEAVRKSEMATYINMMGGAGDIAYSMYFKNKFNTELENFKSHFERVLKYRPAAYQKMKEQTSFKSYQEQYDIINDRIETIHQAFMEKGARIEAYFNILNDLQALVAIAGAYCSNFISIDKNEQIALKKKQFELEGKDKPLNNDKQILQKILTKYSF